MTGREFIVARWPGGPAGLKTEANGETSRGEASQVAKSKSKSTWAESSGARPADVATAATIVSALKAQASPTEAESVAPSSSIAQRPRLAIAAIVVVVAATVVFLPAAMNRWVLPKDVVLAVGVVLAACVPAAGRLPRWLLGVVGVAVVMLVIAAFAGGAPLSQLMGRWPRFEGLVTLPVYFAAAWAGARLLGARVGAGVLRAFYVAVAVSAVAVGFVASFEASGLRPISSDLDRPGSLLGNATDQGVVGVMFAAVLVLPVLRGADARGASRGAKTAGRGAGGRAGQVQARVQARAQAQARVAGGESTSAPGWYRAAVVVGLAFAVISVVTSASRAAVAALFVVAIIVGVAEVRRRASGGRLRAALVTVAVLVGIAALVLLVPLTRDRVVSTTTTSVGSLGDRFAIWSEALGLFWSTPFVGVGPSGFIDATAGRHTTAWFAEVGEGVTLDSAHMWILQAGLAGGIVVLLAAVGLAVGVAVTGVRRLRALSASGERRAAPETTERSAAGTPDASRQLATSTATDASRQLVAGALLGLTGYGLILLTHFTAPATTIFAAVLLGAVVARAPRGISDAATAGSIRSRAFRMTRVGLLGLWAIALLVTCAAEVPMKAGVDAAASGSLASANSAFAAAAALRPWDADVPLIAAQSFAAAADAGAAAGTGTGGVDATTADALTLVWAQRALDRLPDSVLAAKALAVGQQYAGDAPAAVATLSALNERAPNDPDTLHRLGGMLYITGDATGAEQALIQATTLDPSDKNAWLTVQFVAQQLGDQVVVDRATAALAGLGG
ncbi:MAG: hypothetical protein JWQ19_1908 [Subtercola sp.]|nr:hypothetical protein [Subtercola sp.]